MRFLTGVLCALILATLMIDRPLQAAPSCEGLASLALPNATITAARAVEAGAFAPPDAAGGGSPAFRALPAFCRVAATLKPSNDSDIKIEVWVPAANWNGKF